MHSGFGTTSEELQGDFEWIRMAVRMMNKKSGEKVMVKFTSLPFLLWYLFVGLIM